MSDARTVLVVDDDDTFRGRLVRALSSRGFLPRGASTGEEALAMAGEDSPELAVVDLRMPGISGLDVVRGLLGVDPTTRVVVLTGYGSIATAIEAIRLGAVHYLSKPADVDDLLTAWEGPESDSARSTEIPAEVPSLARVEWEHIHRVLADCGGNVSHAARLLGLHRRSLQRKLSKFPARK